MSAVSDLLDRYRVPYVERGANVRRGNLNVRCPFCSDDPSHHMGIMPDNGWYGCWRDKEHRGKQFYRLLAALANIPFNQARTSCAEYFGGWKDENSMDDAIRKLNAPSGEDDTEAPRPEALACPKDFHLITRADPLSVRHRAYLEERGLLLMQWAVERYGLRYTMRGDQRDRIIFPYLRQGKFLTWAGRSIHSDAMVRYKALEDEKSVLTTKECLFNVDNVAQTTKVLCVVEGPFDCVILDNLLYRWQIQRRVGVVALSSVTAQDVQIAAIKKLAKRIPTVVVMLDPLELRSAMQLQADVGSKARVFDWSALSGYEDPGEFDMAAVKSIMAKWNSEGLL